jgi:hypothetical protein
MFFQILQAQPQSKPADSGFEFRENYAWRIKQAVLFGQYIPKDLPDAFIQLGKLTDTVSRLKFRNLSEADAERKLFFSLNRWITTNWGFYEGSRFSFYLKETGITFPEDQALAVVVAWHRHLNGKDVNFKEIRDRLVDKRKKEFEERQRRLGKIQTQDLSEPAIKN